MGLYVTPTMDKKNVMDPLASYQPTGDVRDFLASLRVDYSVADTIRNQGFEEFNGRSVVQYMNDCQRAFNSYIPPLSEDPEEAWRSNTIRPITRNKIISIAAHITSSVLYPTVIARNQDDESDKDAAMVMKDLMDYTWDLSHYERKFVYTIISALYNPCVIIEEGYSDIKRKVKEIQPDGTYVEKEVEDTVYGGFYNNIVTPDEFYISNPYEHDIQKQPFLIRRRIIDISDAEIKYGHNENFKQFVRPGIKYFYNDANDTFYEQHDADLTERQVEEVIYYNRFKDVEARIINGVLLDDPSRPLQRTDKNYPFVKSGYEPLDEGRFFYYKSLADKMAPDQGLIDVLYNMIIDGTFLQLMPPSVVYGDEDIASSVIIPGRTTPFKSTTKFETVNTNNNLNAGLSVLAKMESSASESSQDPMQQGLAPAGQQTAFEIARLEENAKTVLGLFGKMVKFMVEDLGELRKNTVLQHLIVAEAVDVLDPIGMVKFRNVLVEDRDVDGQKMPRKIEFTLDMPETEQGLKKRKYELMTKEVDTEMSIVQVNPTLFKEMKFKVKVTAEINMNNSASMRKAFNLEAFDRLVNNPAVNQEALVRDFVLEEYKPGQSDKYIRTIEEQQQGQGQDLAKALTNKAV